MRPNRDSYLSAVGGSDAGSVNMNASNVSLASNGSGRRSREEKKLPVKFLPDLNLYFVTNMSGFWTSLPKSEPNLPTSHIDKVDNV